jgi:hypothetical protein
LFAASVFAQNELDITGERPIWLVVLVAIHRHHHIRILFDAAGIAQVRQDRTAVCSAL